MQLYNTLTHKKETFTPLTPGKVGIYACGITAYDFCHIGHARSAIVFDVLVRYLEYTNLSVTFVRNFTDVDDKIIARAHRENTSEDDITTRFIAAFHEDMDRLGVLRAGLEPKATEHIEGMIAICQQLIEKGHAYATKDGDVYFRVRSYADYGKLSGRSIDELLSGARVLPGEAKEDPLDFALWKGAKEGEPYWESPWGKGRPGWHIECSAMSEKYLPLPFDIHGGGQDLIFPHHENEIAQTEAATGKELARFWVHNGFVQINSEKMAKSLGNFKTIRDILDITLPEVLRYFLITRHYRSPIDYSLDALEEVERNLKRLYETLSHLDNYLAQASGSTELPSSPDAVAAPLIEELQGSIDGWHASMEDDLNTAAALGHINALLRFAGRILEDKKLRKHAIVPALFTSIRTTLSEFSAVLGVLGHDPLQFLNELRNIRAHRKEIDAEAITSLLDKRATARLEKDFTTADAVRDELIRMGVEIRDTPEGQTWDIL